MDDVCGDSEMTYPDDFINKVICGDCLEIMKYIPDGVVDLVLTDPPYGMNYQSGRRMNKHEKIEGDSSFPLWVFDEFSRIASKAVYVFCRWDNLYELPKPKSFISWVKNNHTAGDLYHEHGRKWEGICFYPKESHEFIKRPTDVILGDKETTNYHPTEKPLSVIRQILSANKGEVVLDPFLGSGTTAVACKQLGRRYIGIEINPEYCKIAEDRLRQEELF